MTSANGGLLALALVVALGLGLRRPDHEAASGVTAELAITRVRRVPLPGGGSGLVDGSGRTIPLGRYQRIVSLSMLSDRLLVELCEPDRVLAFSTSGRVSPWPWRYAGKPAVDGFGPVEAVIALKPDLVLMNIFNREERADQLRQAGITVFNLGQMRGLDTLLPTAEAIGELVGDGARGRRFAESFRERLLRVAAPLGDRPRRRAIYVAVIANHILGGTRGTSYHDVLAHAGLEDVAAARYREWPQYRAEEVAALDPELVVTKEGMAAAVCGHPGLERLTACRQPGRILTLPAGLIDEPGMGMLDAAEQLFALAYPGLKPKAPPAGAADPPPGGR